MITDARYIYEYRGLSTDTKPTGSNIANGSVFFCIDTSEVYMYNGATREWLELK